MVSCFLVMFGMCGPKVCDFSAIVASNRVSILAISGISDRAWFLPSSLELGMSLEEATSVIITIDRTINKRFLQICL